MNIEQHNMNSHELYRLFRLSYSHIFTILLHIAPIYLGFKLNTLCNSHSVLSFSLALSPLPKSQNDISMNEKCAVIFHIFNASYITHVREYGRTRTRWMVCNFKLVIIYSERFRQQILITLRALFQFGFICFSWTMRIVRVPITIDYRVLMLYACRCTYKHPPPKANLFRCWSTTIYIDLWTTLYFP